MTNDHNYFTLNRRLEKSTGDISCLKIETVNRCLTDNCNDCTGSYRNDLLKYRIICHCQCHKKEQALEVAPNSATNANTVKSHKERRLT